MARDAHPGKARSLDVTEGVIWRQFLQLFWPIFLGSAVQQAYQLVNTFVVGHFAGTDALGGIQATQSLNELAVVFCVGVGAGCAIIVGERFGARDDEGVSVASHTAMALAVVIGLVVTLAAQLVLDPVLRFIHTPEELLWESLAYSRMFLAALTLTLVYNMGAGVLRAVGDTRTPALILGVSLLVAAGLDMVFVAWMRLEAFGCGLSYLLAYAVAALLVVAYLMRSEGPWRIELRRLRMDGRCARRMLVTGIPLGVQSSAYSVSNIVVQSSINSFGATVVTGWGLSARIDGIIWLVADSLGTAVTTFVAQNFGARRWGRIRDSLKVSLAMSFLVVGGLSAVIVLAAEPLARFFVADAGVVAACVTLLRGIGPFYCLYSVSANISGTIRGTGESLRPMLITIAGTCLLRVAWVLLVMPLHHSQVALMLCYPVTWVVTDLAFAWYWRRGAWRRVMRDEAA